MSAFVLLVAGVVVAIAIDTFAIFFMTWVGVAAAYAAWGLVSFVIVRSAGASKRLAGSIGAVSALWSAVGWLMLLGAVTGRAGFDVQ